MLVKPEVAFGEVLREMRKQKGYSQELLAYESGIERNYISLLELGKNNATIKIIFKLSEGLEVEVSDLMILVEEKIKAAEKAKR